MDEKGSFVLSGGLQVVVELGVVDFVGAGYY